MSRLLKHVPAVALTAVLTLNLGCAYLRDRGNDAMDIIDVGVSVNDRIKPQFALYFDFFNVIPFGYSNVDGKSLAIGKREIGFLDHQYHNWGVLAVGEELKGTGAFNPHDLHLVRPDQADLVERPQYDVGFVGAFSGEQSPPKRQFMECDRGLHLGWIGIHATMRPVDLIDFILGWTTLDIMQDDHWNDPTDEGAAHE